MNVDVGAAVTTSVATAMPALATMSAIGDVRIVMVIALMAAAVLARPMIFCASATFLLKV
jgi:hypothetical protein